MAIRHRSPNAEKSLTTKLLIGGVVLLLPKNNQQHRVGLERMAVRRLID